MSGNTGEDRAALYALGTLNAEEMRSVHLEAARDPALAADIAAWERRLAPLAELVEPVPPPPSLWLQLEARLLRISGSPDRVAEIYQVPVQRAKPRRRGQASQALRYWRGAALGAMALAAGLAIALVYQPPAQRAKLAMLIASRPGEGGWLLTVKPNGEIDAEAQGALTTGLAHDYELWAGEDGAPRPVPLGLLPVTGRSVIKTNGLPTRNKYLLLVSLEPKGGSRTGMPTGSVLFASGPLAP